MSDLVFYTTEELVQELVDRHQQLSKQDLYNFIEGRKVNYLRIVKKVKE